MNFDKQAGFIGTWGWRIIRGSLFWLLGNFIYGYLFFNMVLAENINEVGTLVLTAILLIPFVFAPGTVAAFSCVRKMFDENNTIKLFKVFKSSYGKNYKISSMAGAIFTIGVFILYTCYWYYGQLFVVGYVLPIILLVLLTVLFLFVLMYISDREETMSDYWKKSAQLLLRHPMLALYTGTEVFFVIFISHYLPVLLLFVAPGGVLLVVHHFYNECVRWENK